MKKKDPALWAALRLHRILNAERRNPIYSVPFLAGLLEEQRAVERGWRMYQKAQERGWTHAAEILLRRLQLDIAHVNTASKATPPPRVPDVPTVADLRAEIAYLQDEFDDVEIFPQQRCIDVTTDEITLEEVCLGSFCIRLQFDRLAKRRDASVFTIVAEDANPAASDSSCTHPHVKSEALCAGDATLPIANALAEGRIGDAFQLVNRVLHTYNPGSAYVDLDSWDGTDCSDCGRTTSSDSLYHCDHCDRAFCDGCTRMCDHCDQSICLECSTTDDDGVTLCPKCKDLDEQEDDAEETDDEESPVPDDPIHDPTEKEPQPQTEITHEHSHSPAIPCAQAAELPGSAAGGEANDITADVSAPQAA